MLNNLSVGSKVYITGLLPFDIYNLVNFNTKYVIVNIDYSMSYPITIFANNSFIHLTQDCIKLAD